MARRINAPGIEINEIDRSGYDAEADNSTIGTATLLLGFADKGPDYNVRRINSLNAFTRTYGVPQTDAERYLYNAAYEVLDNGGVCYTAKLPYRNFAYERYNFLDFQLDVSAHVLSDSTEFSSVYYADTTLTSYAGLSATLDDGTMSYDAYDSLLIKHAKVPRNHMYVVDISHERYDYDTENLGNEIVGIVPVVVSPATALFYQDKIFSGNDSAKQAILKNYYTVSTVRNILRMQGGVEISTFVSSLTSDSGTPDDPTDDTVTTSDVSVSTPFIDIYDGSVMGANKDSEYLYQWDGTTRRRFAGFDDFIGGEYNLTINDYTLSEFAAEHFPTFRYVNGILERKYLTQVGIVVFRVQRDPGGDNRLTFVPVESFVGSLDPKAKDTTTGQGLFIDDVVNSNSDYIAVFSNANIPEGRDFNPLGLKNASVYAFARQEAVSMGFFRSETEKVIHVNDSIYRAMTRIFERSEDRNTLDVDIIADAGVSNIAQFISQVYYSTNPGNIFNRWGKFDFSADNASAFKLTARSDTYVWKKVLEKFDDFAKNVRKDLIFIADGPRPFCLEGDFPIVRPSQPLSTVRNSILPKLKLVAGALNSSYSAGYLDWFWSVDHSTGAYMWMPPSVKVLGVYYYNDVYGAYWDAPAGLNRGGVPDTTRIAFNPSNEEAGEIYLNSWNYAVSYPLDGIVVEGQRTFQTERTALDRVNVRRLMIGLEKNVRDFCKYFNYEGNTAFQRARLTDTIDRYLSEVRVNQGISQYVIVCDERNNTIQTIENNELHVDIAVRPIKSIEFIVLNFIATNQTVNVEEAVAAELG